MGFPKRKAPLTDDLKAGRYAFLFCALMFLFLAMPFIREGTASEVVLEVLLVVVLLSSVPALGGSRVRLVIAGILGLGLFAAPSWGLFAPSFTTAAISSASMTALFAVLLVDIAIDVYRARSVSLGTILGACSAYVLLGLFWFGVFGLIDMLQPEAFSFTDIADLDRVAIQEEVAVEELSRFLLRRGQLFYFSFVTLTTLGYGDVSPVSELARVYAVLEAITGQLFIAILVARLVGLQLAHVMTKEGEG